MPECSGDCRSTQELLDFQSKLRNLHEISSKLLHVASFDDFCQVSIDLGCSRLGFDRLGLWFLDPDSPAMVGSFGTDESGHVRDERGYRYELRDGDVSADMLQPGERRTLFRNIPLRNDKSEVVGYGDCVRANLWNGERILGWLNTDNLISHEHFSDYQVELLGLYATTLGHLITRKRIEETLQAREAAAHHFQEKLKALHEVTSELSKAHSMDEFARRAIELGHSKLGFERLGLWFLHSDPGFIVGTFGIDENGQIRDERGNLLPVSDGERAVEMLSGRVYSATRSDVPLYNDRREIIGRGWKAVAKVWNGDRNIGWLTTDTLFSGQPLSDYQLELLGLYADTLGHLATVLQQEETLATERNLFRTVIDAVPDYIYAKDLEGRFVLANRSSWENTPGFCTESDLVGKTDFEIHPPDFVTRYFVDDQRVMKEGVSIINTEEPSRRGDGTQRIFLTTKVPLRGLRGDIIGLVGVSRDVTEIKRIEKQVLDLAVGQERLKVLEESITSISHDLRTPLSIIDSSLYLLEHVTNPQTQQDKLDIIKRQTALLEEFIEEILLSSMLRNKTEISRVPLDPSSLSARAAQSFRPIAEKRDLAIVTDLPGDLPAVLGNEIELERVLNNLLNNAITYTPDGGSVTLKTFVRGDCVGIEVSDTGCGIGKGDLPYIFDYLFRVDKARAMGKGGMGLGLAIVKRIVEIHHGSVEVDSALGQGSTFRVMLPIWVEDHA